MLDEIYHMSHDDVCRKYTNYDQKEGALSVYYNAGKVWRTSDDTRLDNMRREGIDISQMSNILGRTRLAVVLRLRFLRSQAPIAVTNDEEKEMIEETLTPTMNELVDAVMQKSGLVFYRCIYEEGGKEYIFKSFENYKPDTTVLVPNKGKGVKVTTVVGTTTITNYHAVGYYQPILCAVSTISVEEMKQREQQISQYIRDAKKKALVDNMLSNIPDLDKLIALGNDNNE